MDERAAARSARCVDLPADVADLEGWVIHEHRAALVFRAEGALESEGEDGIHVVPGKARAIPRIYERRLSSIEKMVVKISTLDAYFGVVYD